jgi:fatty acid amide hydrolase
MACDAWHGFWVWTFLLRLLYRFKFILGRNGVSAYDLWQLIADVAEMQKKWSESFQKAGVDAIIFPAFPLVAMPHDIPGKLTSVFSYMFIANLIRWPSGVVPVTTVQADEQHYNFDDIPDDQRDGFAKLAQKVMADSRGLPTSVAIMTPAFQDETCLRVMKEVERVANFSEEPSAFLRDRSSV